MELSSAPSGIKFVLLNLRDVNEAKRERRRLFYAHGITDGGTELLISV